MSKSSSCSIEGRSTLSVLTNFYKKEESRRKARQAEVQSHNTSEHATLPSRSLASVPPFNNKQNVSSNQAVLVHEMKEPQMHPKPTSLPLKKRTYILRHGDQQEEIANRQGQDDKKTEADDVGETVKKYTNDQIQKKRLAKDDTNAERQVENGFCRAACADGFYSKTTNKDIVTCESASPYSTGTAANTDWNDSQYQRFCQQQAQDNGEANNIEEPIECVASTRRDVSHQPKRPPRTIRNDIVTGLSRESDTVDTRDSASSLLVDTPTTVTSTAANVDSNKPRGDDDEFASLLIDTSPKKRTRLRLIGMGKKKQKSHDKKKKTNDAQSQSATTESAQSARCDDTMWIKSDIQGLVETEELPTIESMPSGENPWAHLWQPGAKPFELEVIESAVRKNMDNVTWFLD